jgi:hypothetical protein
LIALFVAWASSFAQSTPTETTKKIDASKDFKINMADSSLSVVYKNQTLAIHQLNELDLYIQKNAKAMGTVPIVIRGPSNLRGGNFTGVVNILKKYKLYHFSIVATP